MATACATLQRKNDDLFDEYRRTRSRALRNRIVTEYCKIADRCALKFAGRGEATDDLRQVALIGLIKSVEGYDPTYGVPFESYATPTILGEIKRHFRDRTWRVSVPRRLKELRPRVFAAIDELEQRLNRSPTPDEVAAHLGVDRQAVLDTLLANAMYRSRSLEAGHPSSREGFDQFLAEDEPADDLRDRRIEAIEAIRGLPHRDRQIVYWRFFEGCTQSEIGARLGIGQVQVSRLLKAALERLREAHTAGDEQHMGVPVGARISSQSRSSARSS